MFLLRYINDPEMRRTIHAATNKSEQFNDFAKWLMFGGDVIAENLRHEQRKVIKYIQLVANMVILYNVQWMSRKLKELQAKHHPVDACSRRSRHTAGTTSTGSAPICPISSGRCRHSTRQMILISLSNQTLKAILAKIL